MTILFEGPCAYVVQKGNTFEIVVHSSNHVTHIAAGSKTDRQQAERVCRRLNAYPVKTRQAFGLL